jgi:hypothetical protein
MKIIRHLQRWKACWVFLAIAFPVFGDPLDNWTIIPSGTTNYLGAVTFGDGVFVAAGDYGTILTSSNGVDWLPSTTGITNSLFGVAQGQGQFVAVGQYGVVFTSSNGVAWSSQSSGTANNLYAVAYTDVGFVAVGDSGTIVTSSNGSNWVVQTSGTSARFVGVGAGFGKAFAGAAVNPPALFWSTNGSVWSYMTNVPVYQQPGLFGGGFAYGNGVLLGVEIRGLYCRSTDGVTWTNYGSGFSYCYGIANARSVFVMVGVTRSGGQVVGTSTNGLEWQTRCSTTAGGGLQSVAYGQHRFVAVGNGGLIVASDPMLWLSNPAVASNGFCMTLNGEPGNVYHVQMTTNISIPLWDDIGVVTNTADTVEFTVPFPADSASAFYRVAAY